MAENAFCAAWICCTPLSWSRTAELSPPRRDSPQVTTALSPWHHNAKALFVAASCGWSTRAVRHSPSSISASSKVCSKSNRTRFLGSDKSEVLFAKGSLGCCPYILNRGRRQKCQKFSMPIRQSYIHLKHLGHPPILTALQNISNEFLLHTLSPSQATVHDLGNHATLRGKASLLKPNWKSSN